MTPPVTRDVEERGAAAGPAAGAQPQAAALVDHVGQPGGGEGLHPGGQPAGHRRVVEVIRLAGPVVYQPGTAVGRDEQRVGVPGLLGHGGGLEQIAQPRHPGP